MESSEKKALQAFAIRIRMALVEAIHAIGSGHVGGALSIADVLAVLYGREMNVRPEDPQWPDRDYLVVSKGHAGPAVYGTLALKGYFPYEERKRMLEAIRYVDLVIPEENWEQKKTDVGKYQIDTFVMGNDWEGKFDFLKSQCEVVYLPRTPEISTTKIKSDLNGK